MILDKTSHTCRPSNSNKHHTYFMARIDFQCGNVISEQKRIKYSYSVASHFVSVCVFPSVNVAIDWHQVQPQHQHHQLQLLYLKGSNTLYYVPYILPFRFQPIIRFTSFTSNIFFSLVIFTVSIS